MGVKKMESRRQQQTIGVFCIVCVVAILLFIAKLLGSWLNIFPAIFIMFGVWMLVLAGLRYTSPFKYERWPFGTLEQGLILIALGGAWVVFSTNWLYSVVILLLLIGAIAVTSGTRKHQPSAL